MFPYMKRPLASAPPFVLLLVSVFCGIPPAQAQTAKEIIRDMTLPPDAALHGTENLSWGSGVASPQPMPVPARNGKGQWFQAVTAWGQVYIPREGSQATNTRCQIRNLKTKLLLKNGKWVTVQSSVALEGAAYREDFANNASMGAGARDEAANGGGLSVLVGVREWAGHNYHFWPVGGRAEVDVANVIGVFTTCEARLILDNPRGPDDQAQCKNFLQMGGDWWLNKTTGWLPDWSANSGIGSTRSKRVTPRWQSFSFCSCKPAEILAKPPVTSVPASRKSGTVGHLSSKR